MQVEKVTQYIVSWLKEYASNAGVKGFVIGVSGGIDSAVTSTLCAKTGFPNTRARLRMTSLYYFAGLDNLLVAGTGNKVEDFGVGFYTKYGDGGVDLSPIADLMKSEVYAIASFLEINKEIQQAPPTDGLWGDDRTDEDQLGASYDELEWAMHTVEVGRDISELHGRQKEVYKTYLKLNKSNQHKMDPIPVCIIPKKLQ